MLCCLCRVPSKHGVCSRRARRDKLSAGEGSSCDTCICMDLPYISIWNTPALGLLLKHGEVDGDVAEAAAAIESIQLFSRS